MVHHPEREEMARTNFQLTAACVSSVALQNGHVRIVCASILGSVLVNLLLILGSALLASSMSGQKSTYSASGTQLLGSLLFVSVLAFLMPVSPPRPNSGFPY